MLGTNCQRILLTSRPRWIHWESIRWIKAGLASLLFVFFAQVLAQRPVVEELLPTIRTVEDLASVGRHVIVEIVRSLEFLPADVALEGCGVFMLDQVSIEVNFCLEAVSTHLTREPTLVDVHDTAMNLQSML